MKNWEEIIKGHLSEGRDIRKEIDPNMFHPSWMGYCKRQIYLNKCGLKEIDADGLGSMQVGTLIHDWIENGVNTVQTEDVEFEQNVEMSYKHKGERITFTGRYDAKCPNSIYDFKTTAGMNYVKNSPKDAHLDQITCYMSMTQTQQAKLVYISKKNVTDIIEHEVEFDDDRFEALLEKALEVKQAFKENFLEGDGDPTKNIPFDKCGCWMCKNEQLRDDLNDS